MPTPTQPAAPIPVPAPASADPAAPLAPLLIPDTVAVAAMRELIRLGEPALIELVADRAGWFTRKALDLGTVKPLGLFWFNAGLDDQDRPRRWPAAMWLATYRGSSKTVAIYRSRLDGSWRVQLGNDTVHWGQCVVRW
jgi:hypothetical protein